MDIEKIRELNDATPFRPYEIHRADGKVTKVIHPDFIALAPSGRWVVVVLPNDRSETVFISQVVALHHATVDEPVS